MLPCAHSIQPEPEQGKQKLLPPSNVLVKFTLYSCKYDPTPDSFIENSLKFWIEGVVELWMMVLV